MDANIYFMGLVISCPLNESEEHCPFNRYRNTPITELLELTNTLDHAEIVSAINFHKACMRERLKSKKAS